MLHEIEGATNTMSQSNDAYGLSDKDVQFLIQLLGLIESQQWELFESVIFKNLHLFHSCSQFLMRSSEVVGMTILHTCARYNPPPKIISLLLHILPELPTCTDFSGRTPLHVAVGKQAGLSTIETLLTAYPNACSKQDLEGKTPLHLSCDGSCKLFKCDLDEVAIHPPRLEVVLTLIRTCPESIDFKDCRGKTLLEYYAILSNASMNVIELLQILTRMKNEKLQEGANDER